MSNVRVGKIPIGPRHPLVLISGPCVVEPEPVMRRAASGLRDLCGELALPLVFKSSYLKDNRTSATAHRGPGLDAGLELLAGLAAEFDFPVTSDVHRVCEVQAAARALDLLQIPALLCRQTSLLEAAGAAGRPVNIKKGQSLNPQAMAGAVDKVRGAGCEQVLLTERGSAWGPDRLVCDMGAVPALSSLGVPVVLDAGHAAPSRGVIPLLARCGVAAGADALFIECHPEPDSALCDGTRMLSLGQLERLLRDVMALARVMRTAR